MTRATQSPRPVFLNPLQVRMPVGAVTSIAHRATGVLLGAGVVVGVWLLDLSLRDEHGYAQVAALFGRLAFKGLAVLLIWALAHHALAGVRHLLTDLGIGSTLRVARRSAWGVNVGGAAIALLAAWQWL